MGFLTSAICPALVRDPHPRKWLNTDKPDGLAPYNPIIFPDTCEVGNLALQTVTPPESNTADPTSSESSAEPEYIIGSDIASPSKRPQDSNAISACQCTQLAVRVLEALQIGNNKLTPSAFDRILRLKKQAIDECTNILECPTCGATSPMVMLLVVICEKLVASFESWSTRYKENGPSRSSRKNGSEDEGARNMLQSRTFFLGVYEVDVAEEQCSLLRALAMVQLRRLTNLLAKLTSVARYQDWAEHQAILTSFISRSQGAATGLLARF